MKEKIICDLVHTKSQLTLKRALSRYCLLIRMCLWLILFSFTSVNECEWPQNQEALKWTFFTKETTLKELGDETMLITPHSSTASSSSQKSLGDVPHVYTKEKLKQGFSEQKHKTKFANISKHVICREKSNCKFDSDEQTRWIWMKPGRRVS